MKNQFKYVSNEDYLKEIVDIKEASEMLGIAPGYLRTLIIKGEFGDWEYRKLGKNIVLLKDSVVRRKGKFKNYKKIKAEKKNWKIIN